MISTAIVGERAVFGWSGDNEHIPGTTVLTTLSSTISQLWDQPAETAIAGRGNEQFLVTLAGQRLGDPVYLSVDQPNIVEYAVADPLPYGELAVAASLSQAVVAFRSNAAVERHHVRVQEFRSGSWSASKPRATIVSNFGSIAATYAGLDVASIMDAFVLVFLDFSDKANPQLSFQTRGFQDDQWTATQPIGPRPAGQAGRIALAGRNDRWIASLKLNITNTSTSPAVLWLSRAGHPEVTDQFEVSRQPCGVPRAQLVDVDLVAGAAVLAWAWIEDESIRRVLEVRPLEQL